MYLLKIKYHSHSCNLNLTEEEKLYSIIDCIDYIKGLNDIDNVKILNINIDYIKE